MSGATPVSRLPLWSPETPQPAPEHGIAAVHAFVTRCRAWAVMELARRTADGRPTHEWESYLRFTDHTLCELENGTLDRWFQPPPPGPPMGAGGPSDGPSEPDAP